MANLLTTRLVRRRSGLASDKRGSTAVEFAVIAPVFLALMFSTFEVGWFYFANSVTEAATTEASRLIRTGQVQNWSGTQQEIYDQFYGEICDVVESFGDCDTHMTVEVDTFPSFEDLAADTNGLTCADATEDEKASIPFEPGGELEIVRVRVCLLYHTVNPVIGMRLAESGSNIRRVNSVILFRNEPWDINQAGSTG